MLSIEEIPDIFHDLTPIPQIDSYDRVCVIEYASAFVLAFNYLRAVWAAKEHSGTCGLFAVLCSNRLGLCFLSESRKFRLSLFLPWPTNIYISSFLIVICCCASPFYYSKTCFHDFIDLSRPGIEVVGDVP